MSKALMIGTVALDTVETPRHGRVERALGGSASYGAVAGSWFAPVAILANVGQDFPQGYITRMKERGIDLSGLEIAEGKSFHWAGRYEENMNQRTTLATDLNVLLDFNPVLSEEHRKARFVFLANIHPALQLSVLDQLEAPELIALDTMNFWITGNREELTQVIRRVHLLLLNEEEARQYCGVDSLVEAGRMLLDMGPTSVVIKKGEHGAFLFQRDAMMSVPAFPTPIVKDPTGAGDTFAGALVAYLARLGSASPENVRRALVVGTLMASFVVEDFSLHRLFSVSPEEVHERLDRIIAMMTVPPLDRNTIHPHHLMRIE
jgi:sugar/nucleoside kinase (ribokinase family)